MGRHIPERAYCSTLYKVGCGTHDGYAIGSLKQVSKGGRQPLSSCRTPPLCSTLAHQTTVTNHPVVLFRMQRTVPPRL